MRAKQSEGDREWFACLSRHAEARPSRLPIHPTPENEWTKPRKLEFIP